MEISELPLFAGLNRAALEELEGNGYLFCRNYEKGTTLFRTGDRLSAMGVVLSGSVHIENGDPWGNRSILSHVGPGQVFAESYVLCRLPVMVDAVAAEDSRILYVGVQTLLDRKNRERSWYLTMQENLLRLCAGKNLTLMNRFFATTPKTVRGRLLTYLSAQAAQNGSMEFTLPFNRQQMADYLNLDRSALSKELCRMRDQGLLRFRKNHFTLIRLEGGRDSP